MQCSSPSSSSEMSFTPSLVDTFSTFLPLSFLLHAFDVLSFPLFFFHIPAHNCAFTTDTKTHNNLDGRTSREVAKTCSHKQEKRR